jgi:hypothetical protein
MCCNVLSVQDESERSFLFWSEIETLGIGQVLPMNVESPPNVVGAGPSLVLVEDAEEVAVLFRLRGASRWVMMIGALSARNAAEVTSTRSRAALAYLKVTHTSVTVAPAVTRALSAIHSSVVLGTYQR